MQEIRNLISSLKSIYNGINVDAGRWFYVAAAQTGWFHLSKSCLFIPIECIFLCTTHHIGWVRFLILFSAKTAPMAVDQGKGNKEPGFSQNIPSRCYCFKRMQSISNNFLRCHLNSFASHLRLVCFHTWLWGERNAIWKRRAAKKAHYRDTIMLIIGRKRGGTSLLFRVFVTAVVAAAASVAIFICLSLYIDCVGRHIRRWNAEQTVAHTTQKT